MAKKDQKKEIKKGTVKQVVTARCDLLDFKGTNKNPLVGAGCTGSVATFADVDVVEDGKIIATQKNVKVNLPDYPAKIFSDANVTVVDCTKNKPVRAPGKPDAFKQGKRKCKVKVGNEMLGVPAEFLIANQSCRDKLIRQNMVATEIEGIKKERKKIEEKKASGEKLTLREEQKLSFALNQQIAEKGQKLSEEIGKATRAGCKGVLKPI